MTINFQTGQKQWFPIWRNVNPVYFIEKEFIIANESDIIYYKLKNQDTSYAFNYPNYKKCI